MDPGYLVEKFLLNLPYAAESLANPEGTPELLNSSLRQVSPAAYAYIGDAVYELYVRVLYLLPPKRLKHYHDRVVSCVRAEAQARCLSLLQPYLTEMELDLLKRGRNAASKGPKRVDPEIYQQATSLETLLGYLYLTNPCRLTELLQQISLKNREGLD
ncbi:MAG: ribonuclease III [Leptolyngbyaceae cyanobacterium CRU_2_3]|nr:ribonuclease III [Leptolyngbyaceae cyanobacterium CRU_2_3]